MDRVGHELEDPLDLALEHAGGGNAACLLDDHRHGDALIKEPKLPLGRLGVGGVQVDAPVQDGPVDVGDHRPDVPGRVRLASGFEDLDRVLDGGVPVAAVAFVAAVDPLPAVGGEHHLLAGVHELADGRVEAKAVDVPAAEGEDHLDGRAVRHVPGADAVPPGAEQVAHVSVAPGLALVDGEDGPDAHVAVNVGAPVERVERDAELALPSGRDDDWVFVLLRHQDAAHARVDEGVDHHVVRQDVELLLVVAGRVDLPRQPVELGDAGPLDGARDELAAGRDGVEKDHQVVVVRRRHDEPIERFGVLVDRQKK